MEEVRAVGKGGKQSRVRRRKEGLSVTRGEGEERLSENESDGRREESVRPATSTTKEPSTIGREGGLLSAHPEIGRGGHATQGVLIERGTGSQARPTSFQQERDRGHSRLFSPS